MRVRHYAQGNSYAIDCRPGSRVVHSPHDRLVVPFGGQGVTIPANSPDPLPLLAESGRCGLSLAGEPEPESSLASVACPACGTDDVHRLQLFEDEGAVHCDACGHGFAVPQPAAAGAQ